MSDDHVSPLDAIVPPPRAPISARAIEVLKASENAAGNVTANDAIGTLLAAIMRLEVEVRELQGDTTIRDEWAALFES